MFVLNEEKWFNLLKTNQSAYWKKYARMSDYCVSLKAEIYNSTLVYRLVSHTILNYVVCKIEFEIKILITVYSGNNKLILFFTVCDGIFHNILSHSIFNQDTWNHKITKTLGKFKNEYRRNTVIIIKKYFCFFLFKKCVIRSAQQ